MGAVIYTRFSPRRDPERSESIAQQGEACQAYCDRQGYEVRVAFWDRAASGSDEEREGLWAAVEMLRRGDVLVVHKRDRLARDLYLAEFVRRSVLRRKATIEAVEGGANGDSPEQVLMRQMLDAFAEFERKIISARTRAAMRRKQRLGMKMSSQPPYGYVIDPHDPKRLAPNPKEAGSLAKIYQLRARKFSLRGIAAKLNQDGAPCRGKRWRFQVIARILARQEG